MIANLSASRSVRIKDPENFDIYTASAFALLHEAGHLKTLTSSEIVNETMADSTAKEALEKLAEGGDKKIHLKTLEIIADLRSISALQKLFPKALENDHHHSHSTGTLSDEPYPEMLEKEASHIEALKHLNGFVSSLIGGALRPAADILMNERGDLEDLENYRKNWQDKGAPIKEEIYDTYKILGELASSPDLYLSAAAALTELKVGMIRSRTEKPEIYDTGNMRLGNAFVQENPGMHYAFIKGMYDAGIFEKNHPVDTSLQKRYIKRYLEAYERTADITPKEQALAVNLAKEMKAANTVLDDILPGTPDRLHPPDHKPHIPENSLKTAPPRP